MEDRVMSTPLRVQIALVPILIAWAVCGYPLIAAASQVFPIDSSILSILGRGAIAVLSLVIVLIYAPRRWRIYATVPFGVFLFFWLIYLSRLTLSLHIIGEPASKAPWEFWVWSVGTCMLPAMAVFVGGTRSFSRTWLVAMAGMMMLAVLVFLASGGTTLEAEEGLREISRWNTHNFNPISMGHLGASLAVVGFAMIFVRTRSAAALAFAVVCLGLGAVLLFFANSRGPIVAFLGALALMLAARGQGRLPMLLALGLAAVALLFSVDERTLLNTIAEPLTRFVEAASAADLSTQLRFTALTGGVEQFLGSPIIGDGVEERQTQFYPHNVIIEAFMATGLVGGIPFLALLVFAGRGLLDLIRGSSEEAVMGMLTVQYVLGAQFSGAIYNSMTFWVLIAFAISHRYARKGARPSRSGRAAMQVEALPHGSHGAPSPLPEPAR